MDKESHELLGRMIDRYGLIGVKTAIAEICSERAALTATQDASLAKVWAASAKVFEDVAVYP